MASDRTSPTGRENSTLRSVLSLLLFIHFFCVFVVLSSTFRRSALQARLVSIFAPYTTFFDLDPGPHTSFHLTLGRPVDDDAYIAVDLYAKSPIADQKPIKKLALPDTSARLGNQRRYVALAKLLVAYGNPELGEDEQREEVARQIALSIGQRAMREVGAEMAVVRCVRRMSQPLHLDDLFEGFPPENPAAAQYDRTLYEADVWIDEDGQAQAQKRLAAGEVAPRRTEAQP